MGSTGLARRESQRGKNPAARAYAGFLLVPLAVAIVGDDCKPFLEKINNFLVSIVDKLMPILLFLIGAALTVDALGFLISGEPLW